MSFVKFYFFQFICIKNHPSIYLHIYFYRKLQTNFVTKKYISVSFLALFFSLYLYVKLQKIKQTTTIIAPYKNLKKIKMLKISQHRQTICVLYICVCLYLSVCVVFVLLLIYLNAKLQIKL